MNPWWLLLIVPVAIVAGAVALAFVGWLYIITSDWGP